MHYFEQTLKREVTPTTYVLRHFRLHTVPNFDVGGGCDPYFDVRLGDGKQLVFDWKKAMKGKVKNYKPKHKVIDFDLVPFNIRVKVCARAGASVAATLRALSCGSTCAAVVERHVSRVTDCTHDAVQGDVKIVFYDWDQFSAPDKMFHFWFNTGFIDDNYLLFHKDVLDRACKDKGCKEFEPEFKIEIFLEKVCVQRSRVTTACDTSHARTWGDVLLARGTLWSPTLVFRFVRARVRVCVQVEDVEGEFDRATGEYLAADNDEDMVEDGDD